MTKHRRIIKSMALVFDETKNPEMVLEIETEYPKNKSKKKRKKKVVK